MSFQNCNQVVVRGDAINTVNGNQYNASVMHIEQTKRERTEYDDYKRLRRGDIHLLNEIHRHDILACACPRENCGCDIRHRSQKTIYGVELVGRKSKFTAVEYGGEEARGVWEEDFRRFSRHRTSQTWQLYGLNRSDVPFLIFHDELVPLGNFYKHSFWGDLFIYWLGKQLGCRFSEIWLNTRGILCEGLAGPYLQVESAGKVDGLLVPSSADMLEDDVSFRFFRQRASSELDRSILECVQLQYTLCVYLDDLLPVPPDQHDYDDAWQEEYYYLKGLCQNPPYQHLIDIIGGLRFDTVYSPSVGAIASWPLDGGTLWEVIEWRTKGLADTTTVGDGIVRFTLTNPEEVNVKFDFRWVEFRDSWLSQSSRAIGVNMMTGTEEQYVIFDPPYLTLESKPCKLELSIQPEDPPPIYLFIYPLPVSISELRAWEKGHHRTHFWSFDENGESEMSEEERRRWHVPELKLIIRGTYLVSGPSHVHTALRNWQIARGFDPSTADYAHSLGCPTFEIISNMRQCGSRQEDVHETPPLSSNHTERADQAPSKQHNTPAQNSLEEEPDPSSWWTWEAGANSGISAFMC